MAHVLLDARVTYEEAIVVANKQWEKVLRNLWEMIPQDALLQRLLPEMLFHDFDNFVKRVSETIEFRREIDISKRPWPDTWRMPFILSGKMTKDHLHCFCKTGEGKAAFRLLADAWKDYMIVEIKETEQRYYLDVTIWLKED